MTKRRVVVFNAIRGHRKPFFGQLRSLGVRTATGHIPEDLTIVQIGGLIGAYPDSSESVIREVNKLRQSSPGQWIQLMGKAEARYQPSGIYYKEPAQQHGNHRDIDLRHQHMLSEWWGSQQHAGVAAVIASDDMAPTLITHTGVHTAVHKHLGSRDAYETAARLNAAADRNERWLFDAGHVLENYETAPGPLWASPFELWTSWSTQPLPFDQIVGGYRPYHFGTKKWWQHPEPLDPTHATILPERQMTYWRHPHSPHGIVHIDDGLQAKSEPSQLRAHTFYGAVVEVP